MHHTLISLGFITLKIFVEGTNYDAACCVILFSFVSLPLFLLGLNYSNILSFCYSIAERDRV